MISRKFEQIDNLICNTDNRWSDKSYRIGLRLKSLIVQIFNYFLINSIKLIADCSYNDYREVVRKDGPVILALWHGDFLSSLYFYRYNRNIAVMASLSKDGDLITKSLDSLGYQSIRGSSSRGGAKVLLEAIKKIKKGVSVAFTIDGPKGPLHEVKPGIIKLAQKTGVPIVTLSPAYSNAIKLKNWDRTYIPMPFSKVVIYFGKPFFVDANISIEEGCEKLKSYMFECEEQAYKKLKAGI